MHSDLKNMEYMSACMDFWDTFTDGYVPSLNGQFAVVKF